jgi:cytosine/adenosine deaminase-related metal-dependent hydrolase
MLFPVEVATSTPRLLERTRDAADDLGVGVSIHCGEAQLEWHHVATTYGLTPVQYVDSVGLLRRGTVLGHGLFIDTHSATSFPTRKDIGLLASSGAAVAHCPVVFARRGFMLESFDRYREAGVTMCLGTDAFPQDMLYEMKIASLVAKIADRNFRSGHARDIFNAATLGGAAALGRSDIGRLAPGALADVAVIDLAGRHIGAVHDPIRSFVHAAGSPDVRHVFVGGREVVTPDGVPGVDERDLLGRVQATGEAIWNAFADYRWDGTPLDRFAEPCFPAA